MSEILFIPDVRKDSASRARLEKQAAIELTNCSSYILDHMIDLPTACWCGDSEVQRKRILDSKFDDEDGVNSRDSFGNTALHFAALHRHFQCIQMLLEAGASPNIKNRAGQTALHHAVLGLSSDENSVQCVSILANHKETNVNAQDIDEPLEGIIRSSKNRKYLHGNTALHFAASRRLSTCVEIMLGAGADVNARNSRGQTPLHNAVLGATQGNIKCVMIVAKHRVNNSSVTDVNVQDEDGVTPLHIAADKKCFQCASVLLGREAYLNVKSKDLRPQDHNWLVMIFVKIGGKISFIAKWIGSININLFRDKNENKIIKSRFALPHLLQEMPFLEENIMARLDKAITYDKEGDPGSVSSNGTCRVEIDFRPILPYSDPWLNVSGNTDNLNFNKHEKETEFLADILKANRSTNKKILTHPVVAAFMHLKWRKICWFFKFYTLLYTILAGLFTFYTLSVYLIYCPYHSRQGPSSPTMTSSQTRNIPDNDVQGREAERRIFAWLSVSNGGSRKMAQNKVCKPDPSDWLIFTVSVSLLMMTVLVVLDELYKLVKNWRIYFRTYRNYFQWVTIICILLTAWPIPPEGLRLHNFQYGAAAYGMFNSWAILLIQVGRYPVAGLYVEMFAKVLQNFGFFIAAYAFLLVAFATAFCVVFPGYPPFSSIPRAMLKVLTMMSGEVDYQDLFYNSGGDSGKTHTWGRGGEMDLFHPITAHLLYAAFVIIVTIVLMNLLVGLAVNDIQGLRKEAELNQISRQIAEISNLENIFFSETLRWCFDTSMGRCLRRHIGITKSLLADKGRYSFSPNSKIRDECLPEEIMMKALQLANQNSATCPRRAKFVCATCSKMNESAFQLSSSDSVE